MKKIILALATVLAIVLFCGLTVIVLVGSDTHVEDWTESFKNYIEAIGVGVGGAWVVWQFWIRRESETALEIDLDYKTVLEGDKSELFFVFFEIKFSNKGKVRIVAKQAREPAYVDYGDRNSKAEQPVDKLDSSSQLFLRALPPNTLRGGEPFEWFADSKADMSPREADIKADLMDLYEIYQGGKFSTDYWIEPGETSYVSASMLLPKGKYIGMVTFVGRTDDEFWRRLFLVQIPKCEPVPSKNDKVLSAPE